MKLGYQFGDHCSILDFDVLRLLAGLMVGDSYKRESVLRRRKKRSEGDCLETGVGRRWGAECQVRKPDWQRSLYNRHIRASSEGPVVWGKGLRVSFKSGHI